MMRHDQSSPATDHRVCPIIGCSSFAGINGEPSEPSVNPATGAWVHSFSLRFHVVMPLVNPVNPQSTKRPYGKHKAATALPLGRLHVSRSNIGKVGSLGSLGSPLGAADHRPQAIMGPSLGAAPAGTPNPEETRFAEKFQWQGRKVSINDLF
uniref:hypothetical protein n=1 Tax=Yoonia sp. TaxID=2212373 RepID=UPI00404850E7